MPALGCAALVTEAAVMLGFAEMLPRIPCFCPPGPAVKYSVSGSPRFPAPLEGLRPNVRAQSPGITMVLPGVPKIPDVPEPSCRGPRNAPVVVSKALITPSPKFPTSRLLANLPKVAGAIATPQGEFNGLPGPP